MEMVSDIRVFRKLFPSFLFAYAEIEVDSAIASVLNSLVPLNTLLLGYLFFKIKSNSFQIIGVIIGFIGAIFLILEGLCYKS